MREFDTGATRDDNLTKSDYAGYLSPLVIQRFGEYMTKHRKQADGSLRASSNWKKGIPLQEYFSSGWRHFLDWWMEQEGYESREGLEDALCGLLFNVQGYLHVHLQAKLGSQQVKKDGPDNQGRHAPGQCWTARSPTTDTPDVDGEKTRHERGPEDKESHHI